MTGEACFSNADLFGRVGIREQVSLRQRVSEHFAALRHPVYCYLVRVCGSEAEAEELTQETFLRLYSHLQEGRQIENVRSWVFKVGRNLALTRVREGFARRTVDIFAASDVPSSEISSEEMLIEQERDERFGLALRELTDLQRQCLHLRGEGLRYREIAEILSISIDSVADALQRAINRVRRAVHEQLP